MPALRALLPSGMLFVLAAVAAGTAQAASTERVSVSSSEAEANGVSRGPTVSADGRFVAFESDATNLVTGDTNDATDIFVRDRLMGTTERISVGPGGVQGDAFSETAAISADGRFVAFHSYASNLVAGDTNGWDDIFVRDRLAGTTVKVSVTAAGGQTDANSSDPTISADGRYVAFRSSAALVTEDTNLRSDIYVRDRQTGAVQRVGLTSTGAAIDGELPRISADGRFVVFRTLNSAVLDDNNDVPDIYVRDLVASTTTRASVNSAEEEANGSSYFTSISADGRFVAFGSIADNLVNGDIREDFDVYLRDRMNGTTEQISETGDFRFSGGPAVSADGRFVSFDSSVENLVFGDSNLKTDVFLRDRLWNTTERVSVSSAGAQANEDSTNYAVSADGRVVVFLSVATNLVTGDTNAVQDVFVRDRGPVLDAHNDLLIDFGANGFYQRMNNATWLKVHNASPLFIAAGDLDGSGKDEAIATFAGQGLFARYNNAAPWVRLHSAVPARFAAGDLDGNGRDELIAAFGSGIFARYNNVAPWVKLHASVPQALAVGDLDGNGKDELIADFGAAGLWARVNNTTPWVRQHASNPTFIATGDLDGNGKDEVIAAFGASGVYARYNNAGGMVRLTPSAAQGLATGDLDGGGKDELLVDFGSLGLRARYNNAGVFVRLHATNPVRILAADLDRNGKAEAIASFPGTGIWIRRNNAGAWVRLHSWAEQGFVAGSFD